MDEDGWSLNEKLFQESNFRLCIVDTEISIIVVILDMMAPVYAI